MIDKLPTLAVTAVPGLSGSPCAVANVSGKARSVTITNLMIISCGVTDIGVYTLISGAYARMSRGGTLDRAAQFPSRRIFAFGGQLIRPAPTPPPRPLSPFG